MTDYQECNKCGAKMDFDTDKYIFGKFVNGQLVNEYPRVHTCLSCARLVIDFCNEPIEQDKRRGRPRRQQV